jgi:hypothetical protein
MLDVEAHNSTITSLTPDADSEGGLVINISAGAGLVVSFPSNLTLNQVYMLIISNKTGSPSPSLSWSANYKFDSSPTSVAANTANTRLMWFDGEYLVQIGKSAIIAFGGG